MKIQEIELGEQLTKRLEERFVTYAKMFTTSDRHCNDIPSTPGQWNLLRLLERELRDIGITEISLDEHGYLIAHMPASAGFEHADTIGFMAHVDTVEDEPGENVVPIIHREYDGGILQLPNGDPIGPAEYPELVNMIGDTLVTSSGDTLLGADDKGGIAEIMTAVEWITSQTEYNHGPIEVIFTPDEETGKGMDLFPATKLKSSYCYTLDGDVEGTVEAECFWAFGVKVTITGRVTHPGTARGKLINATTLAGRFLSMIPESESPEATDGRYGFFCPVGISGTLAEARIELIVRDYEKAEVDRRIHALEDTGKAIERIYPGSRVEIAAEKQYANMYDAVSQNPVGLELLKKAITKAGMEPRMKSIRGGTDGSRLSEMGIPTPNIFTGGRNYHSRHEWISISGMIKATSTIIHLIGLWADKGR